MRSVGLIGEEDDVRHREQQGSGLTYVDVIASGVC